MHEQLLVSLAKSTEHIQTLSSKRDNWIKAVEDGIQIETEASRKILTNFLMIILKNNGNEEVVLKCQYITN